MKILKKLRVVIVILGILFFLLCALIIIKEYKDIRTEEKLETEIIRIEKQMTIKNIDAGKESIDTGKLITTGEYKKVEEAFKKYSQVYYKQAKNIHQNYKDILDNDVEKVENIEQEKPDFENATSELKTLKEMIEQENKNYEELISPNTILSFLDKETKRYYVNYYKENINRLNRKSFSKKIKKELNNSLELINAKIELINFLKNNKDWEIIDNKIQYEDEEYQKEYELYLDNIQIINKNNK